MSQSLDMLTPGTPADIVRSSDKKDDKIEVNTAELSNKFKFFETFEDELERKKSEQKKEVFKRITPPRGDGVVKVRGCVEGFVYSIRVV